MTDPGILLFIDNSNIFVSAKDEAHRVEGQQARNTIRLQFDALLQLALVGRRLERAFVVGSIPPEERAVWDRLTAATGVAPELFERGSVSGGEQGLDQCLQVHMLRAITDYNEPQICVLMTGDGAGYDDGVGFHADLERMHAAGWGIEVLSWRRHCRRALREWASTNGVFVELDAYYNSITFLEKSRRSTPLLLANRVVASPRLSPAEKALQTARSQSQSELATLRLELEALKGAAALKAARKAKHDRRFAKGRK
jgi:hypothetical protein